MKNSNIKYILLVAITALTFACTGDLDVEPEVEQTLENLLKEDPDVATSILAKIYGSLALHGQGAPGSGDQREDIRGDDPGETVYLRNWWNLQVLTTDIAKNRWGDGGLDPLTLAADWSPRNKFFGYMYNKAYFIIGQSNNFINDLSSVSVADKELMIAEVRFLRAMMYYNLMDLFGGVPIVTEADGIGPANKARATRAEVFDFVETELKAIEAIIPDQNQYGRANKATVRMVLAKIYLNAEVYINQAMYDQALDYSNQVINAAQFSLDDNYQSIFQGDNHTSPEIIFPIIGDRELVRSFGNSTYLVNGSYGSSTMPISDFNAEEGWVGHRCTPALYSKFGDLATTNDSRAIFWTEGHNYEMTRYREWEDGYPTTKFRNTYADGEAPIMKFSDIDFPLFRLADAYLMYAECAIRTNTNLDQALTLVNELRTRAHGDNSASISASQLNLDFIIDERARELYYEGHRRQDLIRFGLFTGGNYLWPWKGAIATGSSIPDYYNLFPLPAEAIDANPNLTQNSGY